MHFELYYHVIRIIKMSFIKQIVVKIVTSNFRLYSVPEEVMFQF